MRNSMKGICLFALAFVVVASGFALLPVSAGAKSFTLFGSALGGWGLTATTLRNPGPTVTVTVGDTVALTLHSVDGMTHNWFIDYNNNSANDTGEPSSPDFTGSTAGAFTFTADRVGTYLYRCRYHPTTMTGVIVIRTAPTFTLYGEAVRGWGSQNTTTAITKPGPTLTVNQGDTVTIDLTSVDGQLHSWFIDLNNDSIQQASEPHSADFSSSIRYTFTASTAGNFTYRCQYHPTVMFGTISIRSTGGGGGGGTPTGVSTTLIIGGVIIVVAIVAVAAAAMMRRKKPGP
jgi:plastocyanin